MRLRAITRQKEKYYFEIKDCPVYLNDKIVALMNKPNSPLLLANSIARGLDDDDIFEFDYVLSKDTHKFLGYVIYTTEFCVYNMQTKIITPMCELDEYTVLSNTVLSDVELLDKVRSPLRFKCDENNFGFRRIIYFHENHLYTDIRRLNNFVDMNKIQFLTGLKKGKKELPYGKKVDGGEVVLNNFRPMVKLYDGTFRELEVKDYE